MTKWFVAVLVILLAPVVSLAETVTGRCGDSSFNATINEWKFSLKNTQERNQRLGGLSIGCFIYCIDANTGDVDYAYTYGEANSKIAEEKATYAFLAKFSNACKTRPQVLMKTSRDF